MTTVSVTVEQLRAESKQMRADAKKASPEDKKALLAKANLLDARATVMAEAPDLLAPIEAPKEPTPAEQFEAARAATLAHLKAGKLPTDAAELAALVAGLEQPVTLVREREAGARRPNGTAAHRGLVGHGGSTAPERKDASGKMLRKIWSARAVGPFIVGVCNTAGGYLVRDTRTDVDSDAADGTKLAKKAEAEAYVAAAMLKSNLTPEQVSATFDVAKARIAADGTAR